MLKRARIFWLITAILILYLSCFSTASAKTTAKLPILMYHQVNPDKTTWGPYTISPDMFEADLIYLQSKGYQTVTAAQLVAYTKGEFTLPAKPVMLTFDDGYESFEPYVLPLLEKYEMQAVISVVGRCMDTYTQWENHDVSYSFFSWPALATLAKSPYVEVGAHTYDLHGTKDRTGVLINKGESTATYQSVLAADCATENERFVTHLGETPLLFAYPFGRHCKEAREVLVAQGYQILLTTDQKVNRLTGKPEELLDLGRYNRANTLSCQQIFTKLKLG